ncbi:MAG TPA: DUF3866 family protein [Acidimicrobiales bacterium]|nr:DUF3866 family protein [Acidimicrobiales bacterium]
MATFVEGRVVEVRRDRPGYQQVLIEREGAGSPEKAYVVTALTGSVAVGDEVLANTTAVDLALGTGGSHVVSVNLSRGAYRTPGGGHIMKLRYTPMQLDTGAAEEHLDDLPDTLDAAVVVACTLHSQVPLVVLGALAEHPDLRIAYVMTDGAALPLALSELVVGMVDAGLLAAGTITAGHAFGGMREAVGVPSALTLACHDAGADLVVVGMGPGVVGTSHRLGTTALEAAPILDTAEALGGRGVLCVRASEGDGRARHRGMSHHSATILDLVRSRVTVPVPPKLRAELDPWQDRHRIVEVDGVDAIDLLDRAGLRVTTMGRGPDEDRLFFDTAAAAGRCAAAMVTNGGPRG